MSGTAFGKHKFVVSGPRSLCTPGSLRRRVEQFRFFDTHLRLKNELAFHALALDEQRRAFEPTFWTRTVNNSEAAKAGAGRPIDQVEQRWFAGAHANVGGGYPSDILAQRPRSDHRESGARGCCSVRLHGRADDPCAPITDSYRSFTPGVLRPFNPRFNRPVGTDPDRGTKRTTMRINETIDRSVFERWKANPAYRPANLADWARRKNVDPASISESSMAVDPATVVPD